MQSVTVDLELMEGVECGFLPGECVGLLTNNGSDIKALNHGAKYRVWVVEQGDEDPLAIIAGIARDEDAAWFERADAVLDTIAFGDVEPNPVQWLEPGTNQLHALGGVSATLPDNIAELTNVRQRMTNKWAGRGFAFIPITDQPGSVYFIDRPHDIDGNPVASPDEVIDILTAAGGEVTELETTTIDGVEARVFDMTSTDVGAIAFRFSPLDILDPSLGWDTPAAGRIWLIEHPERGLMMMSTHAFDKVDTLLPIVNELGQAIVETMIFTG